MEMVRLIYVSRMTDMCEMEDIHDILKKSRTNNAAKNITGILCYDPIYFLQCLEGPKKEVNSLYRNILRDDRHSDVLLLEYKDIEERSFGNWTMAFIKSSEIDPETLLAFTKGEKFDPYALGSERAGDFLVAIAAQERKRLDTQR
ncbi:MAG: BLUF domain-containing protein [Candidatus Hydrogenedentes bacterium]|nr:BLUF domain-containing protein [Candidatus Hydrogenedentota bacterium]